MTWLLTARALVLHHPVACGVGWFPTVSIMDNMLTERPWWVADQ